MNGEKRYMCMTEEIELLRASAKLIADHVDPPWETARRLAELAEQKVLTSGLPPATFGADAENARRLASAMGFLPECCPACGEWAGQHERWCIHAEVAETPETAKPNDATSGDLPVHTDGCCPVCHSEGEIVYAHHEEWIACHEHEIAWHIRNSLEGWKNQTPEQNNANKALIWRYKRIEKPLCTCSSEQPTAEDTASELLGWVDLSGLPPVPPLHRRPNLRAE